jgi:hypothetical protein
VGQRGRHGECWGGREGVVHEVWISSEEKHNLGRMGESFFVGILVLFSFVSMLGSITSVPIQL